MSRSQQMLTIIRVYTALSCLLLAGALIVGATAVAAILTPCVLAGLASALLLKLCGAR